MPWEHEASIPARIRGCRLRPPAADDLSGWTHQVPVVAVFVLALTGRMTGRCVAEVSVERPSMISGHAATARIRQSSQQVSAHPGVTTPVSTSRPEPSRGAEAPLLHAITMGLPNDAQSARRADAFPECEEEATPELNVHPTEFKGSRPFRFKQQGRRLTRRVRTSLPLGWSFLPH